MKISQLINLARTVNDFRSDINSISAGDSDGPEVLLHNKAFFELFQTYEEERLCSDNGSIFKVKVCGVTFKCVVYDYERECA